MNSLNNATQTSDANPILTQNPPLNDFQNMILDKIAITTTKIVKEILFTIVLSATMKVDEFVAKNITPKQEALNGIDERTNKFFQKMMACVNEELCKIPKVEQSFQTLAFFSQDNEIKRKLLEGIAFPHVKNLIKDLDAIKTTIIDDIILT